MFPSSFPVVDQLDGKPAYHRLLAEDLRRQGKDGGDVGTSYHESEHPRRKIAPREPYVSRHATSVMRVEPTWNDGLPYL